MYDDIIDFVFIGDAVLEVVLNVRLEVTDMLAVLLKVTDLEGVVEPVDVLDWVGHSVLVLVPAIVFDFTGHALLVADILEVADCVDDAVPDLDGITVLVEEVVADIVLELLTDSDEVYVRPDFDLSGEREVLVVDEDVFDGLIDLEFVGEVEVVFEELIEPVMVVEEVGLFVRYADDVIDLVGGGVAEILDEEVVLFVWIPVYDSYELEGVLLGAAVGVISTVPKSVIDAYEVAVPLKVGREVIVRPVVRVDVFELVALRLGTNGISSEVTRLDNRTKRSILFMLIS